MSDPMMKCQATYEANREAIMAHTAEVLPDVLNRMKWGRNELILDHGSASGTSTLKYFAPIAEELDSRIYALENCASMTAYAAAKNPHPRIQYVYGTLMQEPSPVDGLKFNKIFSLYTLHKIKDWREEVKALYDALAENGEMFMIICIYTLIFDVYKKLKLKWADEGKYDEWVIPSWLEEGKMAGLDPSQLIEDAMIAAGFQIVDSKYIRKTHVLQNPPRHADIVLTMNEFVRDEPEMRTELSEAISRFIFPETKTRQADPHPEFDTTNREYTFTYSAQFIHIKKKGVQERYGLAYAGPGLRDVSNNFI